MTRPERTDMVFSYTDNGDLVVVIKEAEQTMEQDPEIKRLVGELILRGSGLSSPSVVTGSADNKDDAAQIDEAEEEAQPIVNIPDASLLPEEVIIDSDEKFKAVAADFTAGRFNGELRSDVANKLNTWISHRFSMTEEKMEQYLSFLTDEQTDLLLVNYDSIIPADKKEWIVKADDKQTYDVFLLNGTQAAKKQLLRAVLKRFVIPEAA